MQPPNSARSNQGSAPTYQLSELGLGGIAEGAQEESQERGRKNAENNIATFNLVPGYSSLNVLSSHESIFANRK